MSIKEFVTTLLTPGWEAAELVLPVLHVCLFSLLSFLYYCSEKMKDNSSIQIHFKILGILTLLLWGTIVWFTNMYRQALKESPSNENMTESKMSLKSDQPLKEDSEETKEEAANQKEVVSQESQTVEYCD